MTIDRDELRRLISLHLTDDAPTGNAWDRTMRVLKLSGSVPELLDELDATDQRITELESRLAASRDMIRCLEQEREAWPAAYRQRAAKTDARIKELEAALALALDLVKDEPTWLTEDEAASYEQIRAVLTP